MAQFSQQPRRFEFVLAVTLILFWRESYRDRKESIKEVIYNFAHRAGFCE